MKPLLRPGHHQRRIQWARDHLRWQPKHWSHVVFSDESRFELYRHDGCIRVCGRVEELYHEQYILLRVQAGGGGNTLWAAFHAGEIKSDLVVLEGYPNQHLNRLNLENSRLWLEAHHVHFHKNCYF